MKTLVNILVGATVLYSAALNAQDGEQIFKKNCGVCHTVGKGKLVGPDLKDVHTKYKEDWLHQWIKSSQTLVKKGDPVAVKLFEENNKLVMPDQTVSDGDIKTILTFIKETSEKPVEVAVEKPKDQVSAPAEKPKFYDYNVKDSNPMSWKTAAYTLGAFCIVLVIVIIALANTLKGLARTISDERHDNSQSAV